MLNHINSCRQPLNNTMNFRVVVMMIQLNLHILWSEVHHFFKLACIQKGSI